MIISAFSSVENKSKCKILKIVSPTEIYVDLNKNLIFDEKEPLKYNHLNYIKIENNPEIFKDLTELQKFFYNYKAEKTAQYLLKGKHFKVEDGEILIENKKYTDILLNSGYFYLKDNKNSEQEFLKQINTFNPDEYTLYNVRTQKYHTLDCKSGRKSKEYRILKRVNAENFVITCNCGNNPKAEAILIPEKNDVPKYSKGSIDVFFLDLNEKFIPSTACDTTACIVLKSEIENAKESIDFAIYGINKQPQIYNALVNAYNRGIKIRWVTDYDKKNGNYYEDTAKLKQIIKTYNTDKQTDEKGRTALMHNKFFIFDNKRVFTGSANITTTDLGGFNSNISVLIESEKVADIYKQEFEQMYKGKFHKDKLSLNKETVYLSPETSIDVYFSPQDKAITKQIIPLINKAEKYIYIPVFFITKKELVESLTNAHNRGVEIKIINDATNAGTKHSIHKELRNAGIKVKTENYAGKIHSKTIIIDDEISIIGSMNFSNSGENRNDENILIIRDKEITKYLKEVFVHLWNKIPEKYETTDPRAESQDSIGSCFDGIDNDFDGKIDKKDSGCFM